MPENFDLSTLFFDLLVEWGLSENISLFLNTLIIVIFIAILSWLVNLIVKIIIDRVVTVIVRRSSFKWDDIFLEAHVFSRLSHFAPALVIWFLAGWALEAYPIWLEFVRKLTYLYMILAGTIVLNSFLNAWHTIYKQLPISEGRHITGYVQVIRIIMILAALLIVISVVLNKEVGALLTGIGAMAAVLILVFKDTLLGLVASIQISANKMVKIGDWITIPSRGVDGTVLDITLNTIKVQNFDKTIMTLPTYALVQDSFQNWTGMEESGGRRIKRAINIDMNSVRFIDENLKIKLRKIEVLKEFMDRREREIAAYNKEYNIDDSILVNGRRMTNIGVFRAYLEAYLHRHPKIHDDMTFLVRQLKPQEAGIPIEIYVFSKDQEWAKYESLQADIFDHILAVVPEFDLRIFQNPTGSDFISLIKK